MAKFLLKNVFWLEKTKNKHTHTPPHNCIKSYNLINLYIPLPNQRSIFWGFWGVQELGLVQ